MKKTMLAFIMLAACTSDDTTNHMTPVEMCGQPPLAPGFSVAYGSDGYATLPNDQMQAISAFFTPTYNDWANCILSIK